MRHTVGGAQNVVTPQRAMVSSRPRALKRRWLTMKIVAPRVPRREEAAPGVLGPARRRDVQMHVARPQADPIHRRQMADRIALVTVQDELRLRRRAGGEIKQQRIVGARFAVRRERRRRRVALLVRCPARRRRRRPRCACNRRASRRISRAASAPAMTCLTRPRAKRSARSLRVSSVVAGTMTAPSFIAASMHSHSGTTLPSMSRMRSPRLTPSRRSPLATRFGALAQLRRMKASSRRRLRRPATAPAAHCRAP